MRHGKKIAHLGRTASHRKAMMANMASSLIEHKRINTTVAKAKALKKFVEPLITKAKSDTTHNRRVVFSALRNKYAVSELFRDIAEKVADRPGGYTRIIKVGSRLGDNASMALIELVDFNDTYVTEKPTKKRSRRRGGKKKAETAPAASEADIAEDVVEEVTEEQVEEVQAVVDTAIENVEELTEEQVEVVAEVLQVSTEDVEIIAEAVKTDEVVAEAVEVYVERAVENKDVENYTLADVVTEIQFEQFLENPIESFVSFEEIDLSTIGDDMTQDQKEKAQEVVVPVILTRIASMAAFIFRRS